ncbi:hypothetical protein CU100_03565 [Phyllobacterium endophyticum]|uniref:Uncharacterized protein n=1 Tax=Phyllobacterium endophyticum TaxID=1149773 RepID=A0A2P7B064_9HYPH|nr:hypothetical protein CU100_03565 [Phyllobacterium endophyticum]
MIAVTSEAGPSTVVLLKGKTFAAGTLEVGNFDDCTAEEKNFDNSERSERENFYDCNARRPGL